MSKLERQKPEDADRLVLDLYREIPMTRITDVLLQSDQGIGFTETAPYILDGLVSNVTGRGVKEQFSDTGGFSDHVFAMCSILGYSFLPRIRDLPAKRLYAFEPNEVDEVLRPMVAATIREDLIMRSCSDVLQPGFRPTRTKAP